MYKMNPMNYSVSYDKKHGFAILQAICDLDDKIVKELFPEDKEYSNKERDLYTGYLWLKSDIITLLMKNDDVAEMAEKIEGIIKESPYKEIILKEFIHMEEFIEGVKIRKDFAYALKTIKKGSDLAPHIGYSFDRADIRTLALLHKAGKYRTKIESLLEACNFHYELGKFFRRDYEEFLTLDSSTEYTYL